MTTMRSLDDLQILIFETLGTQKANSLKDFLFYLKSLGKKGIVHFSYAAGKDSLHANLSIKENLILDAIPKGLIKQKDEGFLERLGEIGNPQLLSLIEELGDLNQNVSELSKIECAILSIVKSILSNTDYIFINFDSVDLKTSKLEQIKIILAQEVLSKNRRIFIHSDRPNLWLDIATDFITKSDSHYFNKSKNEMCTLYNTNHVKKLSEFKDEKTKHKEKENNKYQFSLNKKSA